MCSLSILQLKASKRNLRYAIAVHYGCDTNLEFFRLALFICCREYTAMDVARITTVLPPAFVLTQEKAEAGHELHLKLNTAWREDLAAGRPASMSCQLPSSTKQVIQLKLQRKEAFRERLLARVFDEHQVSLT